LTPGVTAINVGAVQLRPMLQVRDVAASSRWYQDVLGMASGHGGDEYEMLFDGDRFLVQLHRLDAHEHGFLAPGADDRRGLGVSLWFEVPDRASVDAVVERAEQVGAPAVATASWNPQAHHYEATLSDPDGYVVVAHSPFEPGDGPT
jgi:catechol 2,3-dioxygenase-like lactoylglutathione lyase family enzyme